jgi:hypothetical protein
MYSVPERGKTNPAPARTMTLANGQGTARPLTTSEILKRPAPVIEDDPFAESVPVVRVKLNKPILPKNQIHECDSCGKPVKGHKTCLECIRMLEKAQGTQGEVVELTPSAALPTARCFMCHSNMVVSALKQSAHGGFLCVNRKGCDERREMRIAEVGSAELAAAVLPTPKESAIAALTPVSEPTATLGNGLRLVPPTVKELASFKGQPQELIRVTDEDEPSQSEEDIIKRLVEKNPQPVVIHDEEFNRELLTQLLNEQGFRWVMNETLMAEGFESTLTHLMGVICDSADDEGHLPKSGFLSILETLAKAARQMGHKTLAFYLAESFFHETGKRVRGF